MKSSLLITLISAQSCTHFLWMHVTEFTGENRKSAWTTIFELLLIITSRWKTFDYYLVTIITLHMCGLWVQDRKKFTIRIEIRLPHTAHTSHTMSTCSMCWRVQTHEHELLKCWTWVYFDPSLASAQLSLHLFLCIFLYMIIVKITFFVFHFLWRRARCSCLTG